MIALGFSLLCTALAVQSPGADSLRRSAQRLPEAALAVEVRAHPLAVREAVAGALAGGDLATARNLAAAYAAAWRDSFLVREVARFTGWPPSHRAAKVWADSVRRVGVAAWGRDGPLAAVAVWRRALIQAEAIADTAGMAAVLGNIGAGFLEESQLDSADAHLERAAALAGAVGDLRVEANALGTLALVSEEWGDWASARARYARAAALRERIGDTRGQAADHNNLGLLAQAEGDLDEARRQFESALALNRREGREEVAATNLVNLAGLASVNGDFARAEALYRNALATWRTREMWSETADALRGLGQLELRRGDYPAARAALVEALAILERTGPLVDAITVRRELAAALAAVGDLQGALEGLRRAQQTADSARVPAGVRAGVLLARADLAVQLNAPGEAERLYARATFLYRQGEDPGGEAEAHHGSGLLFLARDNYARAGALLDAALRIQRGLGNRRAASLVRLSLGQLARLRGDTTAARRHLRQAHTELMELGDPVAAAAALVERAELEAAGGLPAVAESLYGAGLEELRDRIAPEVVWRLRAGLGVVLRAQGATDAAAREFRAAVAEVERPSRSLAVAERRAAFLADKWDTFAQLALTEQDRGRPGAAFEASERLRAREMLELLARGRIDEPAAPSRDLVAREQDLRLHIAELTSRLPETLGEPTRRGGEASPASRVSAEGLQRAQESYAELILEMRERAPRHAGLVTATVPTWRQVAQRLAPDQAFIEYLVSDSGSLAFVVSRDTIAVVDLGIGRRDLARLVEFVRGTLELRGAVRADPLWRAPLRRLHQHLVRPLQESGALAAKTRLVLVPHAELHYIPFAALLDEGGGFLVEHYELMATPSAAVWLALGERGIGRAGAGVLAFAPQTGALPASQREVAAIALLAGADVLTGRAATEAAFRREAPARRILHLATYGVLNKRNPLFSFVQLAPGVTHDGRLEVHEVFGLDLTADLVVLSACQTGLGSGALADVPAGDDWVGLTRSFLHAGAASVVATLWPVDDWATAALMERFYEAYTPGSDPAKALAASQRALLATPSTMHPSYWAGFVAVGSAR